MRKKFFLYLASRSPRRRSILRRMGIAFRVIPSRYREPASVKDSPSRLVVRYATRKARQAVIPRKKAWVLGADTIVYCRQRVLGKPRTRQEAFAALKFLSGRTHWVYTGVALYSPTDGRIHSGYAKTRVDFRRLSGRDIANYLKRINPFDKVGSYAIQVGQKIVREIEGSYTNVMGLPCELVSSMLRQIPRGTRASRFPLEKVALSGRGQ